MSSSSLFLLITSLFYKSTVATAKTHGWTDRSSSAPPKTKMRSKINKVIGVDRMRSDEESYTQLELKSLVANGGDNGVVTWLSHEKSVVSHHQLEKARITLRGGADEDYNSGISISPSESFDKKRSESTNWISGFAKWYMKQMEAHELRTKCISAGFLGLVGDVCAQEVGHYLSEHPTMDSDGVALPYVPAFIGILYRLDKQRMLAMFCDGALTTGPLLHFVYAWYESILPIPEVDESAFKSLDEKRKAVRKRFCTALIHVLFDNFIMAILYVFLMMIITATLEGKYASIPHEIQHDFYPAVQSSWRASLMGLAPMQLISFFCLPMELRVLAVNVQDVIWVTVMSYVTHRNRH